MLGTRRRGEFTAQSAGRFDTVHLIENHIGPGERLETGVIRLANAETPFIVRWRAMLSTGEVVSGELGSP